MKMKNGWTLFLVAVSLFASGAWAAAQEPQPVPATPASGFSTDDATKKVEDIARQVDQSAQAHELTAGILTPIYQVAERMSFPMFHWIAFALMATGVVSFTLQLVLAKLVVLMRMSISPSEILADALGLTISVIGLVLTTQAAAENSSFTRSPAAVLSATAVGVIAGFIFYVWGQRQEVQAAQARAVKAVAPVIVQK